MEYATLTETEWQEVERVRDLLDQGEVDQARLAVDALLKARPGHPDLRIADAEVCIDEGEPARALETLRGAERSADPALFFYLRALANFYLVRFEPARDDAERAVAIHGDLAESHHLLARLYEHLGEPAKAREHDAEAQALDPVAFSPPLAVSDEDFGRLVEESQAQVEKLFRERLDQMPEHARRGMAEALDMPILVVDLPWRGLLTVEDPPLPPDLFGLFVGRNLFERRHDDVVERPEGIYLFRRNLLRACADRVELKREIGITVRHEVGHLLGLEEDDLEEWGLA